MYSDKGEFRELLRDPILKKVAELIKNAFGFNDVAFTISMSKEANAYTIPFVSDDDYNIYEILPDGTRKTWCKDENGEAVEGYLPNMPTHFMLIPKTPDGFAWPYNKEKEIK